MENSAQTNMQIPQHQIRAAYDGSTIRVYQAYSDAIADTAIAAGTFVSPPFKMTRMTWIKPSFLWMMYRAGWGEKDEGQRRILAIDITREGFEWALAHACLSHAEAAVSHAEWQRRKDQSPVRIQWDPERDLHSHGLAHRAIQIGLGADAVDLYVKKWIRNITDVTPLAREIHGLVQHQHLDQALKLLPAERPYVLQSAITVPVPALGGRVVHETRFAP